MHSHLDFHSEGSRTVCFWFQNLRLTVLTMMDSWLFGLKSIACIGKALGMVNLEGSLVGGSWDYYGPPARYHRHNIFIKIFVQSETKCRIFNGRDYLRLVTFRASRRDL
jgi:hypothetical protein